MRSATGILLLTALVMSPAHAGQLVHRANSVERIVRYEYVVTNVSDRAQDISTFLSLPQSNPRQEVAFVYPEPGYERLITDDYGNQIAIYIDRGVKPDEIRRHGWMAAAKVFAAVWQRSPEVEPLGDVDRNRYLQDSRNYLIQSPVITGLRDSLIKPEMGDFEKASAVFQFFADNVTYARDDKWDSAPEVIQRKQGSCSEYTFSFLSVMRASGIPCRYTGGVYISQTNISKYDPKVHEDAVFHRWAEVFLKDYGWFPVDGSRAAGASKRFGNSLNFWGQLSCDCLQTYCGDGGDKSYIDWDYIAHARSSTPGAVKTDGVSFFIEAPAEKLKPTIEEVEKALAEKMPPESLANLAKETLSREVLLLLLNKLDVARYPQLAEELLKAHHPTALYLSIYCDRTGLALPSFLSFPLLCDEYLRSEILKHRANGSWDTRAFEHWWRKARPEMSFSETRKAFVLNNKSIDLN